MATIGRTPALARNSVDVPPENRYHSLTHRPAPPRKDGNVTKTTAPASPTLLNRELSWLDFNERVLELAADECCRCSSA